MRLRYVAAVLASTFTIGLFACQGDDPNSVVFVPVEAGAKDSAAAESQDAAGGGNQNDATAPVEDASSAEDASDAGKDAEPTCERTPTSCTDKMKSCADQCKVTYNICKQNCNADPPNLQTCFNGCKANLSSCQDPPCKGDCVVCAQRGGSCTGATDCSRLLHQAD